MSNPGDTGEAIATAMRLGAQTALMDEAWWLPSPRPAASASRRSTRPASGRARSTSTPTGGGSCNESNSYMEVGKAMYERNKTSRAVPCWLIFDDRYRKRYAHVRSHPGYFPKEMLESGRLKKAATLAELAGLCGIDADGLAETVDHFNEHAANGVDPDYGRGESAYNRSLGDPNRKVHPCLGPIDEAPFYACEVLPGDIGTCGGLVTDEHARVLDEQRPAHRGPLRHRQQHRHGHGPPLPRAGREHRQHDGVRLPRGAARRRRGQESSRWLTSSREGRHRHRRRQRHRAGHRRALRRRGRPGRHRRHRRRGRRGAGRRARRRRRVPADRRHRRRPGAGARRLHRRAVRRAARDGEQRRRRPAR